MSCWVDIMKIYDFFHLQYSGIAGVKFYTDKMYRNRNVYQHGGVFCRI